MGYALCLQPWIQIGGNANTILQPLRRWADLSRVQDVAFYVEVASCTLTAGITTTIAFQSSPAQDEAFMSNGATGISYAFSTTPVPTFGVQPVQILRYDGGKLARHLRWSVQFGAAATQITFRVWLNLNPAGF
jgi:hypothetical protein